MVTKLAEMKVKQDLLVADKRKNILEQLEEEWALEMKELQQKSDEGARALEKQV